MVVVCEDKKYTVTLLDKIIKELWKEIKDLSFMIGSNIGIEMDIVKLVHLADEAQQHYYLLSRSEKAVISDNLYYELAKRYEIDVEKFTFAGELARR